LEDRTAVRLAETFKALSDPTRVRIVSLLAEEELCVCDLAEFLAGTPRTGWLLATTLLTYLGFSLYLVNGPPYLMGATGPEERNHAFSVHIALIPLAAFAGSLVAGALPGAFATLLGTSLDDAAPYRYTLWLSGLLLIPGVLALVPTRSVDDLTVQALAARASAPLTNRAPYGLLLAIALIMALRFGGRGTVTTFFNVYLDEGLGTSTVLSGVLSAIAQLLSVPAAVAAPLLTSRWGHPRPIFWGTLGMALCILPLALIPHWTAAGLGFVSSGALFSTSIGPIRVFSQELVTPEWRPAMASAFMMGAGLAFSGMPLLGAMPSPPWATAPCSSSAPGWPRPALSSSGSAFASPAASWPGTPCRSVGSRRKRLRLQGEGDDWAGAEMRRIWLSFRRGVVYSLGSLMRQRPGLGPVVGQPDGGRQP
jgi:MFS family permease